MTRAGIERSALAVTAALAVAAPIYLLSRPAPPSLTAPPIAIRPIRPQPAPPLDAARARSLFAAGDGAIVPTAGTDAADGPRLIGIVGRLGQDAVAMVRGDDGGSVMLAIGESAGGWRLESIARDAVLFSRGRERRRIDLPGAEAAPPEPQ